MKRIFSGLIAVVVFAGPVMAEDEFDAGGTLNPDEMSLNSALQKAINGEVSMVVCAQGYLMTKKGSHEEARRIFKNCAEAGYTGTMTWMSYMEQNGFGEDEDATASAEWDQKAAELGDPIGEFNYGLNLLRGYGVEQNEALGKALIDRAARNGVKAAKQLQDAEYDYRAVTPDADEWKFEKKLY
ncbi:MAG: sel1 repeat family protein [Rhizobiaceae bacterium]|nr:sel1 repeat family protein [Rhizobiaceae bacterium]